MVYVEEMTAREAKPDNVVHGKRDYNVAVDVNELRII